MPWKMEGENVAKKDGLFVAVIKNSSGQETEVTIDPDQVLSKIGQLTKEAADNRKAADDLKAKHDPWAGLEIDGKPAEPDTVKEALLALKNVKDKKLLDAGEVTTIRNEAVKEAKRELEAAAAETSKLKEALESQEKNWQFATSQFVKEKITYPPAHAAIVFGPNFKPDNGKLAGFLNGEKIMSRKNIGEAADFDEAMEYIVDKDPFRTSYLRASGADGSGVKTSNGTVDKGAKTMARSAYDALPLAERNAKLSEGYKLTDG